VTILTNISHIVANFAETSRFQITNSSAALCYVRLKMPFLAKFVKVSTCHVNVACFDLKLRLFPSKHFQICGCSTAGTRYFKKKAFLVSRHRREKDVMTPYDAFQSFDITIGIRKTIPYSIVENYLYYLPGKSPTLKLYSRGFHIETLIINTHPTIVFLSWMLIYRVYA